MCLVASLLNSPPWSGPQVRLIEDGSLIERGEEVARHTFTVEYMSLWGGGGRIIIEGEREGGKGGRREEGKEGRHEDRKGGWREKGGEGGIWR